MSRNTAALLIAVMFHLLLLLLLWILVHLSPTPAPPKKPQQQRIKVALKPAPKAKQNAAVKNKQPPQQEIPPMPKGKQLEKIVTPTPPPPAQLPASAARPQPAETQAAQTPPKQKTEPLPDIPFVKPTVPAARPKPQPTESNTTEAPEAHKGLFAKLSKKQYPSASETTAADRSKREGRIPEDIREAYGDSFGKLSEGEQKYLLDNQEIMRRITQEVLNRVGRVNIPSNLRVNSHNIVEFYLYPNGDISEIKLIKPSGFYILDDTTKETIEYAYSRYPRPEQKTLIRYKVGYFLRGY